MGKTAVIFPGQGAQYVGMAKDFYDNFEDSKKVFDEADEVLDIELKKICFEENDDINKTEYTQPAMVAAEVAIYEHLKNAGLKADVFAAGDVVDVKGTSKGHGTAGAIKRWNFSRLRMSHGTGPNHRHAGSLGACSSPSRVFKGKKMAGHYGHETVTVQNLTVVKVDAESNLIAIKGAIPGPKGGIVVIADAVKA